MHQVFVHGIEFYGFHGVPHAEREVGHRYLVDIELEVEGRAPASDGIEDTVDYSAAAALVVELGGQAAVNTVERLARLMAEALLDEFDGIQQVTITVAKPFPPMPLIAQQAGVTLTVERQRRTR